MQSQSSRLHTSSSPRSLVPTKLSPFTLGPTSTLEAMSPLDIPKKDSQDFSSSSGMKSNKTREPPMTNRSDKRKSHADVFLNRFPIPPDLINFFSAHTERPATVKIFKTKLEAEKTKGGLIPGPKPQKTAVTSLQIKRADPIESVNVILDRQMKEYEKKKKNKIRGSMFVTDLWAKDYEKNVIKAAKIDKELKVENHNALKPLEDKFQDIVAVYEKKNKKEVPENLNGVWEGIVPIRKSSYESEKKGSELALKTEPAQIRIRLEEVKGGNYVVNNTSSTSSTLETPLSTLSPRTSFIIKKRTGNISSLFRQQTEAFKQKASMTPRAATEQDGFTPKFEGFFTTDSSMDTEERGASSPRSIRSQQRSKRSSFAPKFLSVNRNPGEFPANGNISEESLTPRLSTIYDGHQTFSNFYKTRMSGFHTNRNRMSTHSIRSGCSERENRKLELEGKNMECRELLMKCHTELGEKDECLGYMEQLEGLFNKQKKRDNSKARQEARKKEIIEDFKYMLQKREKKNSKVPP